MKRILIMGACAVLLVPAVSFAATLSFGGNSAYSVGDVVSVPVYLTTGSGEVANAVSSSITYPSDLLTGVSIAKTGSIFTLWPDDPTFSPSAQFDGVILNPGWSGQAGLLVTLVFQAKAAGTATLTFSDASVLANDGNGTDILSSAQPKSFTIRAPAAPASTPVAPAVPAASAQPSSGGVVISSPTHPDQGKWYKSVNVELDWKNPSAAAAVRIGYDKYAAGQPTVVYAPLISQKDLTLKDGIWYFHVQEETADGWGPVSTFKIQIDTTPPNPVHIQFPHGATSTDPRPVILFNTTDDLSGIDHYDVVVAGNSLVTVNKDEVTANPYPLPEQQPGPGTVTVTAYDEAGNSVSDEASFNITGIAAPQLDPIDDITTGSIFQVSGITTPAARVDVYLKDSNGKTSSQWARSSETGSFRVVWENILAPGVYTVTAQTTDDKGAKSFMSAPMDFSVQEPVFLTIGRLTIAYTTIFLIAGALLALLLFGSWYLWHSFYAFRKRLLAKVGAAETSLHEQFAELKDALAEEVAGLEKVRSRRDLTLEEERFINRFTKMLDRSKRLVDEKITNITT